MHKIIFITFFDVMPQNLHIFISVRSTLFVPNTCRVKTKKHGFQLFLTFQAVDLSLMFNHLTA